MCLQNMLMYSLYIYIHVNMFFLYVRTYVHVNIDPHVCVYMYIYIYVCKYEFYVRTHICACKYRPACVCIYMYICIYIYVYIYTYIYIHIYIYIYVNMNFMYVRTYVHVNIDPHVCVYIYMSIYMYTHIICRNTSGIQRGPFLCFKLQACVRAVSENVCVSWHVHLISPMIPNMVCVLFYVSAFVGDLMVLANLAGIQLPHCRVHMQFKTSYSIGRRDIWHHNVRNIFQTLKFFSNPNFLISFDP